MALISKGALSRVFPFLLLLLATAEVHSQNDSVEDEKLNREAVQQQAGGENMDQDDVQFWSRFVQEITDSIPSSSPSEPPSPAPSPAPSPEPSSAPSPSPSESPSDSPTGFCIVEAFLTCEDEGDGTPCDQIPPISEDNGQCAVGTEIDTVRFRLEFCSCDESRNQQPGFSCTDNGNLPAPGSTVNVQCADGGNVLINENIPEGGTLTVGGANAPNLPDELTCSVRTTGGTLLQTVIINTSGQQNLYLTDKFGSFVLESCDEIDCLTTVEYTYGVINTGQGIAIVEDIERLRLTGDRNNPETDIRIFDTNDEQVAPGERITRRETETLNRCEDGWYRTEIEVNARPPEGIRCPAPASTEFELFVPTPSPSAQPSPAPSPQPSAEPSEPPSPAPSASPSAAPTGFCIVEASLICEDENDGTPCVDIPPISEDNGQCSVGTEIDTVRFRLEFCSCDESRNQQAGFSCTDNGNLPGPGSTVDVQCSNGGTVLVSETIREGGTVTVGGSNGPSLPDELTCTVTQQGTLLQTVVINTSGQQNLFLTDKFGSLVLESCDELDCLTTIEYTYGVENTGQGIAIVEDIVRLRLTGDRNNPTTDTRIFDTNDEQVAPGETITRQETEVLNRCESGWYRTEIEVNARPPEGIRCPAPASTEFELFVATPSPSASPSEPPSPSPSAMPSEPPSPSPSASPSEPPSPSPSDMPTGACIVEAYLTCQDTSDGTPCDEIESIDGDEGQCAVGPAIQTVRFRLEFCTCDESRQTQDGFSCTDNGNLPPSGSSSTVNVECSAGGAVIVSETIPGGGTITVGGDGNTVLPDELTCTVRETSGTLLQTVVINTSGQQDLYLKDKFGSLELESCDDTDCITEIQYTYGVSNTGQGIAIIEDIERIRLTGDPNNPDEDIRIIDTNNAQVAPGESIERQEEEELDVCQEGYYRTEIEVNAVPPDGVPCPAPANYEFELFVRCRVIVEIMCESQDGVLCEDLESPDTSCVDGDPLTTLRFNFETCTCDEGENTHKQGDRANCRDINPLPAGSVTLTCIGNTGELLVPAQSVSPGDEILIMDMAGLPSSTLCTIGDGDSTIYQQVVFDTSGTVDLDLGDKFGSLELEACVDSTGDGADCITTLCYLYNLENVGTSDMDITQLERTRNGETENLFPLLNGLTFLVPGQSTSVIEKEDVDLCVEDTFVTEVTVNADSPNGEECFDEDVYEFPIIPDCDLFLEVECVDTDGNPCDEIQGEDPECFCPECVTELRYRYVGATPAEVIISATGVTLFQGSMDSTDENNRDIIVTRFGSCLPDQLDVVIRDPIGNVINQFSISSVCSGQDLLSEYGGVLQFSGYTCQGQAEANNCYEEVCFDVTVTNTGHVETDVTEWVFEVNGERLVELDNPFPIQPEENVTVKAFYEVNTCEDSTYVYSSNVNGMGESGEECPYDVTEFFAIGTGTRPPSPSPSESPSDSPTGPPTPEPSASPSDPPTGPPTPEPSASPSDPPSPAPSESPSIAPTGPCVFDLDIECIPPAGSNSCNATPPPVQQCEGRPTQMGFLYNGGFCNESWNVQNNDGRNLFLCQDLMTGPSPDDEGALSWITVTDTGFDTVYYNGPVGIDEVFYLNDGGNRFEANQIVQIFQCTGSPCSGPGGMIQDMQYHSSCSSNLFLKDRFGAVQLVEWVNEVQGTVSCFANQTFELDITIPIDIVGDAGGSATITGLTIISNVDPFFFNLTDQVAGTVVPAGGSFVPTVNIPIDLTVRRTYNLLITVTAVTSEGRECIATQLTSFTAGYPLPPIFPTLSPTVSPTGTNNPTTDPGSTRCFLAADVECSTFTGRSCRSMSPPTSQFCLGSPQVLYMRYTGDATIGNLPSVYINILGGDREDVTTFDGPVRLGHGLLLSSGVINEESLLVTIYQDVNGFPGNELDSFDIDVECDGSSLGLLQQFGALQLTGFETDVQGLQSAIELITVDYIVRNDGDLLATVNSAIKTSDFTGGPNQVLPSPTNLQPGEEINLSPEFVAFPVNDNIGVQYQFSLETEGVGTASQIGCEAEDTQSFQV